MVPRLAVPVMAGTALAAAAFLMPLRVVLVGLVPLCLTSFGSFFGFDFPAELFVFGVLGLAVFAFVVGFFGFERFVAAFFLVGFGFVFRGIGDEGTRCGSRQRSCVR